MRIASPNLGPFIRRPEDVLWTILLAVLVCFTVSVAVVAHSVLRFSQNRLLRGITWVATAAALGASVALLWWAVRL